VGLDEDQRAVFADQFGDGVFGGFRGDNRRLPWRRLVDDATDDATDDRLRT
jgi:hypothetical protein